MMHNHDAEDTEFNTIFIDIKKLKVLAIICLSLQDLDVQKLEKSSIIVPQKALDAIHSDTDNQNSHKVACHERGGLFLHNCCNIHVLGRSRGLDDCRRSRQNSRLTASR